jgi:hypothetical protein
MKYWPAKVGFEVVLSEVQLSTLLHGVNIRTGRTMLFTESFLFVPPVVQEDVTKLSIVVASACDEVQYP